MTTNSSDPLVRLRACAVLIAALSSIGCVTNEDGVAPEPLSDAANANAAFNQATLAQGRDIFRFDTFGGETYWTDTLQLQAAISSVVTPLVALSVGLKVDVDALPLSIQEGIKNGSIPLNSTATTIALLKLNAVLGVKGTVVNDVLTRVAITCAFCHSTVDNSFAPGIGRRLDGWPNRDLDIGRIVNLSASSTIDAIRGILLSWGPGRYDPRINQDGIDSPVILPPAFGLRHVRLETYTGDGPVSYWNAYVAITQMHGHGTFSDPRIDVNVNNPPDLVTGKLDALRQYQLSLEAPAPGPIDRSAAKRGKAVFMGAGQCVTCHYGVALTDVNDGILHSAEDVAQNPLYASRSATKLYRTTPLRGLWNPPQLKGPYFHDGSAMTLQQVVDHYVGAFGLTLTAQQKADLVEYLKTL